MIRLAFMLHILVMLLLTLRNNVIAPHFRVANVLLRSAFLSDLLLPAKTLHLAKQKENTDIITIVNLVQITHEKYIELKKIYSSHPEKSFEQMPTLKDVLSNVDNQNRCQGATLKNFECDKEYLERNVSCLIQDVIKCFEQRYDDLMDKVHEDATNKSKKLLKVTGCYHTLAKSSTAKFGQTK